MTEPAPDRNDDPVGADRQISDVGLPGPDDEARTDDAAAATGGHDVDVDGGPHAADAGLEEAFPPERPGG
jgi:hypothetical protein